MNPERPNTVPGRSWGNRVGKVRTRCPVGVGETESGKFEHGARPELGNRVGDVRMRCPAGVGETESGRTEHGARPKGDRKGTDGYV